MLFSPLLPRLSASLGLGCSVALYVLLYFLPSSSLWQERSKKQENFFCCLLDIGKPAASTVPFHLLLLCVVPHSSSEVLVGNAALLSDTRFSLPVIIPTKHRINYINDCADVVIRSWVLSLFSHYFCSGIGIHCEGHFSYLLLQLLEVPWPELKISYRAKKCVCPCN